MELYAFISRADTADKIAVARAWLQKNVDDIDLLNDLIHALFIQSNKINDICF